MTEENRCFVKMFIERNTCKNQMLPLFLLNTCIKDFLKLHFGSKMTNNIALVI